MFGEVGYIIGQILGGIAVALGFVTYQMKDQKKALAVELFIGLVFTAHYLFIGAFTAVLLNAVGPIKCIVYYLRNKRGSTSLLIPMLFAAVSIVLGVLTWEGWYSACLILGVVAHSFAFAVKDTQKLRRWMFIKAPLCLIYNVMVLSIGGIVYECIVLISSTIGIIRHRMKEKQNG